jgi:hypothetical protein
MGGRDREQRGVIIAWIISSAGMALWLYGATAQTYPTRPITMIVPDAPAAGRLSRDNQGEN